MNQTAIARNSTRSNNYSPAANQFSYLKSPKIVQEQTGQFTSALAHEVRNPLANISLAVQMLQSLSSDNSQKLYLDIIMRGALRINDIITDLLAPGRDGLVYQEKHSIHQLLDEVLAMTEDRIMLKNITVIKEYAVPDCEIVVNREKMKIALANIIINAIDAMPSENGQLKLTTASINGRWVIQIEDNGIGISKKNLKTIFKPYFTNKLGGMGLGLSTTLDILLSNYAKVDVQSEEGMGTRFILSFDKISSTGKRVKHRSFPVMDNHLS